jgi:hypothetical protein
MLYGDEDPADEDNLLNALATWLRWGDYSRSDGAVIIIRRPLASFKMKEISEHMRNLAHFLVKAKPLACRGVKLGAKFFGLARGSVIR